jgi:hypothetical protein
MDQPRVNHSLHSDDPARKADADGGCIGLHFYVRRRRTRDGFTRMEGRLSAPVERGNDGELRFTVYLTDDERRAMAAALLEGLA